MSIKTKIAWAVFLLVASLMTLLSLAGYHYLAHNFKENLSRESAARLEMVARHTDRDILQGQEILSLVARGVDRRLLADPQSVQRLLDDKVSARAVFPGGRQVLDLDGRVVAESPALAGRRGLRLLGRDYVAMVLATGKPYVSASYRSAGRPTLSFAVPIVERGELIGVLAGHNDLLKSELVPDPGQLGTGRTGTFFIVERNRTIIAHPDRRRILERIAAGESPGLDLALQQHLTAPNEESDGRGGREITAALPLRRADWLMVSQFPVSEAYRPLDGARSFFALALAVALGLTHLALRILIGRITTPLARLTSHVRELPGKSGAARLLTDLPEGGDEVAAVAAALNEMVKEMDRRLERGIELERLIDRQRRFAESILEGTSTPLFAIDTEHRVIIWNRAMTELTGLSAREMLGSDRQWQPFYPEQRPTLCDLVLDGRSAEAGSFYADVERDVVMPGMVRAEGWFPMLNGRERRLFFDAAPVKQEGQVVAVVETLYDITARTRAEEKLRLLSRAVEQTGSSIVITDPEGVIRYVNRKFCEATGYQVEEVLGRNPRLLSSGRQGAEIHRGLWEALRSGREWHGELHNRRKDGTTFWESAIISPITDATGAVSHFLAVQEDISQRKATERELHKKQAELIVKHEQLSVLFRQVELGKREWEQTLDCIDDMVAMAGAQHRIRRCNRAFMNFVGVAHPKLEGADWRELLRAVGLEADPGVGWVELFHAASARWFTLRVYSYDEGRGEVITLHDLTEIKKVSEELATAYQELKATHSQLLQQEKMASIGQLAAGVAHEINNPMGFILSNLGTMEKYLERLAAFVELQSAGVQTSGSPELLAELAEARRRLKLDYVLSDAKSLLAESRDGAERVRTIVQNLKSFSRVDEAQTSCVDLNECLETTVSIAWNELKYKATLSRDFGELPPVRCLPQQLNQVFLNLLVNAAHAIEKQGEIGIRTSRDGDRVRIAISDTGCGIPAEIQHRIFEPFFTTKEIGKGTGLGLSISYDIIKKHGGSISVQSAPGSGTTFTVELPIEGVPA